MTYLTSWKNRIELSLTPTIYYQYCLYINNYLDPTFGHLYISEIRTRLIQDFIFSLVNSGVGTRTIRFIYQVFHHILDDSQKEGLIPANSAVGIKLPKYKYQEMKVFTEDQGRTFLQSIHGQADEAIFYLAVTTGLRQSELVALKWSDLSVSNQTIRIKTVEAALFGY